jgi:hypothetical protein
MTISLDLITIRSSTYAVLAAITAMFAFGAAQGEERKPIAFPAGERFGATLVQTSASP